MRETVLIGKFRHDMPRMADNPGGAAFYDLPAATTIVRRIVVRDGHAESNAGG